ncbi:hypothetical protein ANCDUO_10695 [Ancylostoma duodenale]|uniref:Uncharacterized protein n=1 Tax=Ancylostoma duodenale TaxID=51022 RepID=A0A0C2CQN6_9BILA|nr:hypothetical protein ANCDUO_10695 [Ancylostoma duodenale]
MLNTSTNRTFVVIDALIVRTMAMYYKFYQEWPFILLITLGYFNSHVCIEVDRQLQLRKKRETEEAARKKE